MPKARQPAYQRMRRSIPHVRWAYRDLQGLYHEWPRSLPDWDPDAAVHAAVTVRTSWDQVQDETGLAANATVRLGLSWYCRGTQVRGRGSVVELTRATAEQEWQLSCTVPGSELGGTVDFQIAVVLRDPGSGTDPLSARYPGSVLWETWESLDLEGSGGRFPMVWIDFKASPGLPDNAAWSLEWDPYALEEEVLRGPRLYLNKSHEQLKEAIERPRSEASAPILEMLYFDVGRALITGALRNEDFVCHSREYESGSVGRAVNELIQNIFPGHTIESLRHRMEGEPIRFERDLQHGLRILQALG
jgi:hypothetical protein